MAYFNNIIKAIINAYDTIIIGLKVAKLKHVTLLYPDQKSTLPENARYELEVKINDCIGCDLCAKICPVDCIEIKTHKAEGIIGYTSAGSKKRLYIDKFDIDMAKCMFCGLCPTVCPTYCIFMTKNYARCFKDIKEFNYNFLKPKHNA